MDETAQFWAELLTHGILCGLMCAIVHELIEFAKKKHRQRKQKRNGKSKNRV